MEKVKKNYHEDDEICPFCKIRKVEVDDFGYYGCKKCMPKISQDAKARQLDQDGTGQDWEVYNEENK